VRACPLPLLVSRNAVVQTLVVARKIALLGRRQPLGLVYLRTQLQTLRHTRLGASLFQPGDLGTVQTLISFVTLAGPVEALSVGRAILRARFQTAVETRKPWGTRAQVLFRIALAVTRASIGAVLECAGRTAPGWSAVARPVEATTVWLIAPIQTELDVAVGARPTRVTMALLGVRVADTVASAVQWAGVDLKSTLNAHKPSWAETITLVAFATVGTTVCITRLLCTRSSFPANLTQTGGIISTISVLAVRTNRI